MRPQQELFHPMDELLKSGINLFNNRQFFACHEVLEAAWTPEKRRMPESEVCRKLKFLNHGCVENFSF